MFRPAATAQLELADTLALNTGTVILTYRLPPRRGEEPSPFGN
jgi:hypothetical protein